MILRVFCSRSRAVVFSASASSTINGPPLSAYVLSRPFSSTPLYLNPDSTTNTAAGAVSSSDSVASSSLAELSQALNTLSAHHGGREVRLCLSSHSLLSIEARLEVPPPAPTSTFSLTRSLAPPSGPQWVPIAQQMLGDAVPLAEFVERAKHSNPAVTALFPPSPLQFNSPITSPRSGMEQTRRGGAVERHVIFDGTSINQRDPRTEAADRLHEKFPNLVLRTDHTAGLDLQGNKTHTIAVHLAPSSADATLTPEETAAVTKFVGESVGLGFRGTLKRALTAAFEAIGETFQPDRDAFSPSNANVLGTAAACVLALYAQLFQRGLEVKWDVDTSTCSVRHHDQTLAEVQHTSPIVGILNALEVAAESFDPVGYAEIKKKVDHSGLYVLLPDQGVHMKNVLEKILLFFLGSSSSALELQVTSSSGLFASTVYVTIPLKVLGLASEDLRVMLGKAVGRSKKDAHELAMVKAIEDHFPRIYEDQLSFHPEIKKKRSNEKASEKEGDIPPHISRGLMCQLEWAAKRKGLAFQISTNKNVIDSGGATVDSLKSSLPSSQRQQLTVWICSLTLYASSDTERKKPVFSYTLQDMKKSRCMQKVVAVTLWEQFRSQCEEMIQHAIQQRLIFSDGTPVTTETIVTPSKDSGNTGEPSTLEEFSGRDVWMGDPLLRQVEVTPYQYIKTPPSVALEGTEADESLLSLYRRWANGYAQQKYHSSSADMFEKVTLGKGVDGSQFSATAVTLTARKLDPRDNTPIEELDYITATDKLPIRALMKAYMKLLEQAETESQLAPLEGTVKGVLSLDELKRAITSVVSTIPPEYPAAHPLNTVARLVRSLYGGCLVLHTGTEKGRTVVKVYGVPAATVTKEGVSATSSLPETRFYIGAGAASSMLQAAVSACRRIYQRHFKILKSVFDEEELVTLSTLVRVEPTSAAQQLFRSVQEEIQLSLPSGTPCQAQLLLSFDASKSPPIQLVFRVRTPQKTVELERANGNDVAQLLQSLCSCVSKETRCGFDHPKGVLEPNQSHYQRITVLYLQFLGFPLECEAFHHETLWYVRLSLVLDIQGHRWCLCTGHAPKKSDAVEAVAVYCLKKHFFKVFTDLSVSTVHVELCESNVRAGDYIFVKQPPSS